MANQDQINENIISMLGIESLPDEKKIPILKKMNELVQKRIVLNILRKLDINNKEKFVEATSNNNEEELQKILDNNNINMVAIIEEETNNLKQELKDKVDNLNV